MIHYILTIQNNFGVLSRHRSLESILLLACVWDLEASVTASVIVEERDDDK
jgi:hypothetical protein